LPDHSQLSNRLSELKETLSIRQLSGPDEVVDAVVAILIRDGKDADMDLLLIHRAMRQDDPWSGQIGLPGGRVEKFDLSTRAALHREVREEIGLNLDTEGEEIGRLSVSSPMRRLDFKVQPWVYGLLRRPSVKIGPEVQGTFWVSLSKLPGLRSSEEIDIRGTKRMVDAFLVDGHVVWGFTHRVLNELLVLQGLAAS
jgi:8-oxo-dGTP pyrophosphatase MutT (NUDIX family)